MSSRKVRVGDLISWKWPAKGDPGIQMYLNFNDKKRYGIVMEVDEKNGMIKAHFFDKIYNSTIPIRIGYFDIIE